MNVEQPEQTLQNTQSGDVSQAFRIVLFVMTWLFWVLFLVVPTLTGMHGVMFADVTNSAVFLLIGLVFCTAQNIAIKQKHTFRMVIFAATTAILSFWF